jgi:LysR family transcriptional regulator of gallate degradation
MSRPVPAADAATPSTSLHHLRAFHAVATAGGIRRSAAMLYRASSALTRSVAALEAGLGTALFERKGRGMLLTAAGERVLERARRIEQTLREVSDDARARGNDPQARRDAAVPQALFHTGRLGVVSLLAEAHHMPTVAGLTGLSQPAISAAVAKLEGALGHALFRRTARGMLPSDLGERWVVLFRRVLAELRNMEADMAALNGVVEGVVRVGALPLARTSLLPGAIAAVLARHPKLRVRTFESPYEDLTAGLLSGEVDFIVGALRPLQGSALAAETLFEHSLVVIGRRGHPLASRRRLRLADLDAFQWVLSRSGTPLRALLHDFYARHGHVPPVPSVETGDLAVLRGLLLDGDMLTALYPPQLAYELQAGSLVVLPFALRGTRRQIGITTRTGAQLAPGALALIEEIRRRSAAEQRASAG